MPCDFLGMLTRLQAAAAIATSWYGISQHMEPHLRVLPMTSHQRSGRELPPPVHPKGANRKQTSRSSAKSSWRYATSLSIAVFIKSCKLLTLNAALRIGMEACTSTAARIHSERTHGTDYSVAKLHGVSQAKLLTKCIWCQQDTVEDVDVHPASSSVLCSVGDDLLVAFWDTRKNKNGPVTRIDNAHTRDINCCAWNPTETNYVLTGSSDSTTHL